MKKISVLMILTLVLALTSTLALAGGTALRGFGVGRVFGFPDSAIPNLTKEQSAQIQTLRDSFLKAAEPLHQELLEKTAELRNLELTPKSDPDAVKAKQNEVSDLRAKLYQEINNYKGEVQRILSSPPKPQTVIPGEIFQVDPQVDQIQMYGG